MIYIDTSVALAALFAETRAPAAGFWNESLVSSRLFQFEILTRMHARRLGEGEQRAAEAMMAKVELVEMTPENLARALDPFPVPVRTLDGLHLATMHYLRSRGQTLQLASYDLRFISAAQALRFPLAHF